MLSYSTKNSEFYRKYEEYSSIKDFPIINKNIIKENENLILSDEYKDKELHSMSTSGSTGTPFTIKQNDNKRKRLQAEIMYFGELANYRLGDRIAFLKVWTDKSRKSYLERLKLNMVMLDSTKLDKESLDEIIVTLRNDKKIRTILGNTTSLDILSRAIIERGHTSELFNIQSIICTGEFLSKTTKENLKKAFLNEGDPISRYSSEESGILAQQPAGEDFFMVNNANYYIEFLKLNSDEEADENELCRIVITDLYNYAMPIIRYDIGDLAVFEYDDQHRKVITSIEGKKRDCIYDVSGGLVSAATVTEIMFNYNKIKQYQLIQEEKYRYTLKLNGSESLYMDEDIIESFNSLLGSSAKIRIEHVGGIPLLQSSKFQSVICKYKGN